jgi:ribosomal protein S18 acetylase RimI-like enzyme
VKVRKFALSDLSYIVRIERASFGAEAYGLTTFLAHIFRDRKGLFVAEDSDGRIVGYVLARVGLRWLGARRGGITSIAVDPAHRRRGFGRALMATAVEYLRRSGVGEVDLEVNVANRAAHSLYQAFGFVQSRLLPHYYGPSVDGVRMVLDVRRARAMEPSPQATSAQQSTGG